MRVLAGRHRVLARLDKPRAGATCLPRSQTLKPPAAIARSTCPAMCLSVQFKGVNRSPASLRGDL